MAGTNRNTVMRWNENRIKGLKELVSLKDSEIHRLKRLLSQKEEEIIKFNKGLYTEKEVEKSANNIINKLKLHTILDKHSLDDFIKKETHRIIESVNTYEIVKNLNSGQKANLDLPIDDLIEAIAFDIVYSMLRSQLDWLAKDYNVDGIENLLGEDFEEDISVFDDPFVIVVLDVADNFEIFKDSLKEKGLAMDNSNSKTDENTMLVDRENIAKIIGIAEEYAIYNLVLNEYSHYIKD